MDKLIRGLELLEMISASDAMSNACVDLEDAAVDGRIDGER